MKPLRVAAASSLHGLPGSRTQGRATTFAIHGFWAHAELSCLAFPDRGRLWVTEQDILDGLNNDEFSTSISPRYP
jgi:streptogramin lyase